MMVRKDQMTLEFVNEQQSKIRKTRYSTSNSPKASKTGESIVEADVNQGTENPASDQILPDDSAPSAGGEGPADSNSQDKLIENLLSN